MNLIQTRFEGCVMAITSSGYFLKADFNISAFTCRFLLPDLYFIHPQQTNKNITPMDYMFQKHHGQCESAFIFCQFWRRTLVPVTAHNVMLDSLLLPAKLHVKEKEWDIHAYLVVALLSSERTWRLTSLNSAENAYISISNDQFPATECH